MSILNTVKKMLGIHESYTHFDTDIIIHINTVFVTLNQLGVGGEDVFEIYDETTTWEDFSIDSNTNALRSYMYLKVKMLFDPPVGSVKEAMERTISELEFRLNLEHERTLSPTIENSTPDCNCPWYD